MNNKKIILFGGTFDPVHLGHTKVAVSAREFIDAERVIFVPARRSPLKGALPRVSDNDRQNMIELAISGYKKFEMSDYELAMLDVNEWLFGEDRLNTGYNIQSTCDPVKDDNRTIT